MIVLDMILPSGDYAGLAYTFIALITWISVIIPIFCLKYCKLIREEKLKILFGFYYPLVVSFCHMAPFTSGAGPGEYGVIITIAVALFAWVAIWTFIPLLIRLNSAKKQDDNNSLETQE